MSTETKPYDGYSNLILGAKVRAEKSFNRLIELVPELESSNATLPPWGDLLRGLYDAFFSDPLSSLDGSNEDFIEAQFKKPDPDYLGQESFIQCARLLFLTIDSLALVGYLCGAMSKIDAHATHEDLQTGVHLIWHVLAKAELQLGEFFGLHRAYKIRTSDLSAVSKALAKKMTEARHSPNRRAKNAAIARWLIKGALEYDGNKSRFAEDELKILKDESPPIAVTERTIREDWLSPKSIVKYEQERQQKHE